MTAANMGAEEDAKEGIENTRSDRYTKSIVDKCKAQIAPLAFAFWAINIGLALMVLLSVLPIGLAQVWASVEYETWYARSAEFLHSGHLNQLRWMRMIGDSTLRWCARARLVCSRTGDRPLVRQVWLYC